MESFKFKVYLKIIAYMSMFSSALLFSVYNNSVFGGMMLGLSAAILLLSEFA